MSNLFFDQAFRNNPGDATARREHRVGENAHQPEACTTINETELPVDQRTPKFSSGLTVLWSRAVARSGENADLFHAPIMHACDFAGGRDSSPMVTIRSQSRTRSGYSRCNVCDEGARSALVGRIT